MKSLKWEKYPNATNIGPILMASCFSKNGYYGCCWIIKVSDGYILEAGSNDTGNMWKSPDDIFETIEDAKEVAEKTWRST